MIANTASTAYPTQAENFNREWTRIDAKLVGPPESGLSAWVVMGFDDMGLRPWGRDRQTLLDEGRGFYVIETHCVPDGHCAPS